MDAAVRSWNMYAERRRRNRHNECFERIRGLVPNASKVTKFTLDGSYKSFMATAAIQRRHLETCLPNPHVMDQISLLGETVEYIKRLKQRLKQLEEVNKALRSHDQDAGSFKSEDIHLIPAAGSHSSTQDLTHATPEDENTLRIEVVRNECSQEDTAINIFSCLRDLRLTVAHASVSTNVYRLHAIIKVKMPKQGSRDQYALCSEIQEALRRCLS